MKNYLNFENDIKDLESELEKLKDPYNQEGLSEVNTDKISKENTLGDNWDQISGHFACGRGPGTHCLSSEWEP